MATTRNLSSLYLRNLLGNVHVMMDKIWQVISVQEALWECI